MLAGVTCRGYKTSYHDGHVQVHEDKVKAVDAAPCLDHVECLLPVLDSGYAGLTAALQNAEGHLGEAEGAGGGGGGDTGLTTALQNAKGTWVAAKLKGRGG